MDSSSVKMSDDYIKRLKIFQIINEIAFRIGEAIWFTGYFFEIFVIIFFLYHFKQKTKATAGAYFYLLTIGCCSDFVYTTSWTLDFYFTRIMKYDNPINIKVIEYIDSILGWYLTLLLGPSNMMLCLNRLTSVMFLRKNDEIWSKYFGLSIFLLFLYPFIVNGNSFSNLYCRIQWFSFECAEYKQQLTSISTISNGVFVFLSLVMGLATFIIFKKKFLLDKTNSKSILAEKRLLFHTLFTTFFFLLFCIASNCFSYVSYDMNDIEALNILTIVKFVFYFSYSLYHYFSLVLLFVYSLTLRHEFIKFYHLQWLFRQKSTSNNSRLFVVTTPVPPSVY